MPYKPKIRRAWDGHRYVWCCSPPFAQGFASITAYQHLFYRQAMAFCHKLNAKESHALQTSN